ncbi:hypothetical protein GGX14DRAFT_535387 [Mycena pura]|uniref:Transaldolase n=1 Tax=Mycena pura TaxID=153505 RepID=A0AAD6VAC0_9AGAR|nr:hypothetical protein GGX14DRAFT_535387 [Mycena pura]
MSAPNALQTLRSFGIRVASDAAEYHQLREFDGYLMDATTNPSMMFAAASKAEYAHIVQDAVDFALGRRPLASVKEVTALAMDRLLSQVTAQIARIVPGRVSVSTDPRLAYDTDAIISKARVLVALLEQLGIPPRRVLVKIPATFEGIRAARALEHPPGTGVAPIYTNMTLVFGLIQAAACAQAGVSVISPFIGRVKDWWEAQGAPPATEVAQHPGILLVRAIRVAYRAQGTATQILAAGFRAAEEVVELGAYGPDAGPDCVTIPPTLLAALRARQQREPRRPLDPSLQLADAFEGTVPVREYFGADLTQGAAAYAQDIFQEKIATVKVPEGLAKFSADTQALEELLRQRVIAAIETFKGASAML